MSCRAGPVGRYHGDSVSIAIRGSAGAREQGGTGEVQNLPFPRAPMHTESGENTVRQGQLPGHSAAKIKPVASA